MPPSTSLSASDSAQPTTITRSMSRKSLSLDRAPLASTATLLAQKQLPRRIISSASTSRTLARPTDVDGGTKKRLIKPIGSATTASGMGVRRGPAVVRSTSSLARHDARLERRSLSPAKISPAKMSQPTLSPPLFDRAGTSDPFSINFRAPVPMMSLAVEGGKKRSIGDVDAEERAAFAVGARRIIQLKGILSPTRGEGESPAKRVHLADSISPTKVIASIANRPASPARQRSRTRSDENASTVKSPLFDSLLVGRLALPSSDAMDVDKNTLSSPVHQQPARKQSGNDENGSDDELDFLSPRKKRAMGFADGLVDEEERSVLPIVIRSPMQRKRVTSPVKSPVFPSFGATSVPMSRPSYSLSSMAKASPVVPRLLSSRPAAGDEPFPRAGASSSALPTKYLANPASKPVYIETVTAPPPSNRSINAPSSLAVSQPMRRSGIPRPTTTSFPPLHNPHASRPMLPSSLSSAVSTAPRRTVSATTTTTYSRQRDSASSDSSMASSTSRLFDQAPAIEMADISDDGNVSIVDQTAQRLANLQAMLSRLSMPRQSTGGASSSMTLAAKNKRSSVGTSGSMSFSGISSSSSSALPKSKRRTTMTGAFQEEYSVPLTGGDEPSTMGPPLSTSHHRTSALPRHTSSRASLSGPPPAASSSSNLRQSVPSYNRPASSLGHASSSGLTAPRVQIRKTSMPTSSSTAMLSALIDGKENSRVVPAALSTNNSAVEGLFNDNESVEPAAKHTFLKDCVVFVDVRTLEGDDAGMIFVDMLKGMSARVTTRPTPSLTHIIYKSGRPSTLTRYKATPAPKPFLIGISWVVRCAELGERVDETPYLIQEISVPTVVPKRRRSMEPKLLSAYGGAGGLGSGGAGLAANTSALQATIAASIDRARRRSMQFAPKIGSPLAKRVVTMMTTEEDSDEVDETF